MKLFCRKDGHYQHCLLLNETLLMMSFNALMMCILLLPSNNAQVLCFMERTWRIPTRFSCDCRTPQWLTMMACIMALSLCNPNPSNICNHNLNFLQQFGCKYVSIFILCYQRPFCHDIFCHGRTCDLCCSCKVVISHVIV